MPLNIDWQQILLHLLNFAVLTGGLYLILFKPVKKFIEERKHHYEELEENIKKNTEESEKLKAEYTEKLSAAEQTVREKISAAESESAAAAGEHIAKAKEQAKQIIEKARTEGERQKQKIIASAEKDIAYMVVEATEKLVAEDSTPEHDKALYDRFIAAGKEETDELD